VRLPLCDGQKVDLESIEWRSISTQSILPQLISEFLSCQIAPLSCLILPKLSTLVGCCLGWMAQHLQPYCMWLATHCHHIVTVPSLLSNCRCPIAIHKLPLPLPSPYYIDESIVVVMMAACADGVLLFPQPTEHVAHNRCCRQPQRPQSGIGRSSLPSQHKADCCVKRGQIVGDLLIVSSLLPLRHCYCAAASCLPSSPLCQIPQLVPPPFVTLLCPTCSVGCRVSQWPPSASQLAPPPLFTPLHSLVVALRLIFWLLGLPSPSHHASTSHCAPLVRLVVPLCCMVPRLLSPPIAVLEMPLLLSSTLLPSVAAAASSPSLSPSPSLSLPSLLLPLSSTLKGWRGGDILFFPGFQGLSFSRGGLEASSLHDILLLEGSVSGNNDFEVIICTCINSC
jgi:hypothetical protein